MIYIIMKEVISNKAIVINYFIVNHAIISWLIARPTPFVHDGIALNEKEGLKNYAYHATTAWSKKVKVATTLH